MSSSTKISAIQCLQIGSELMYKLSADYFIDCAGDGTVGALADAEYPQRGHIQHRISDL